MRWWLPEGYTGRMTIRSLFWLSRFTDVARRVAAYRNRGVALGNWVGVSPAVNLDDAVVFALAKGA